MDLSTFYFVNGPLEQYLSQEENDLLKKNAEELTFETGQLIFKEGTFPKGVFILTGGRVKIFQLSASGEELVMNIHTAQEIFGYRPLLCDERYPVSACAIEISRVLFIPKKHFHSVLQISPALSNTLLRFLSHEFTVWINTIGSLSQCNVKERVILHLLILCQKYQVNKKWPVEIMLSRADLASLTATSIESLARTITNLKANNFVSAVGRKIQISKDQYRRLTNEISAS